MTLARTLTLAGATPWVLHAALRVDRLERRLGLEQLAERLRTVRRLPPSLRRPEVFRQAVDRLLPHLPPRRLRSCLRRSLILLDLYARCGITAELMVGTYQVADRASGHAWLSVDERRGPEHSRVCGL